MWARRSVRVPVVSLGSIRRAALAEDRALVEREHHEHDRDAGLGVAGEDGGGDRRGAAVARQERRVDVDDASGRHLEDALPQYLAVGGGDEEVGLERRQLRRRFRRAHPCRLEQRQPVA